MNVIVELLKFFSPAHWKTPKQIVGSIISILLIVLPLLAQVFPGDEIPPATPSQDVLPVDGGTKDAPDASDASTGILATLAAGLSAPFGCSAANQNAWKTAGLVGAQCYAECGIGKVSDYVQDWKGGRSINGEDVGWDALSCLWPCLAKAGGVLVPGLMLASADEPASVSSAVVASGPEVKPAKIDKSPLFCTLKPELLDNSKAALRAACGCGDVPRCSLVIRNK